VAVVTHLTIVFDTDAETTCSVTVLIFHHYFPIAPLRSTILSSHHSVHSTKFIFFVKLNSAVLHAVSSSHLGIHVRLPYVLSSLRLFSFEISLQPSQNFSWVFSELQITVCGIT
jgi:hypothetical protein